MRGHRFLVGMMLVVVGCAHTASKKDVANARIHYDMGIGSLNSGQLRTALAELLKADKLDPEMYQTQNALGMVFHALGEFDESLERYERTLEINPKFTDAHNNRGVLLLDMGRYEEAIAAFEAALEDILYVTPSLAEGNMGWAYYKKGDVEKGTRHLRNAVAISPTFCRGYLWLARIGLDREDVELLEGSARRFDKYCLKSEDGSPLVAHRYVREMGYYRGLGLVKVGDRAAAIETFRLCATDIDDGGFGGRCAKTLVSME